MLYELAFLGGAADVARALFDAACAVVSLAILLVRLLPELIALVAVATIAGGIARNL